MNFDRSLIFAYLEEDNIQRAYFRVRPLLTLDGDVREEAASLWPNEGGLRIVPDRNEQHTFKSRMRTLGAYCVVDLRHQPPEAGKIRTNKNYRPDKGEINQFILYSDTVHELPPHTFYQLIDGPVQAFAESAVVAITPRFYIRENDTLYGPIDKATPALPDPAAEAAGMLFELPCPDGVTRRMLCMDKDDACMAEPVTTKVSAEVVTSDATPAAPAAVEKQEDKPEAPTEIKDEALPIGQELHILKNDHEETLKELDQPVSASANLLKASTPQFAAENPLPPPSAVPLTGTPLIRTPLHISAQQTKNKVQEVVSKQWSVGKYEPPVENLPVGIRQRSVENPVEAACHYLGNAWRDTACRSQLTDYILSLDGAQRTLESKLCNGDTLTILQRVLRGQLQDLEAERLTALCELDRARKDVEAYKQELLSGLTNRIIRETEQLENKKLDAEKQVAQLKAAIQNLTLQRDALLAKVNELQTAQLPEAAAKLAADLYMCMPATGVPLRLSPISGQFVDGEALISRFIDACNASGVKATRNGAIAALMLLALSPRIGIASATPSSVATLIRNIAAAMGWSGSFAQQYTVEQQPLLGARPVDTTPAVLLTSLPNYAPIPGVTRLTLNRNPTNLIRNGAYDVSQWPVMILPALPFIPELEPAASPVVSKDSLTALVQHPQTTDEQLDQVLGPVLKAALPLSGSAKKELYRFVSVCAGFMEGGLPSAVDWGIYLWIVPALERGSQQHMAVKALLDEYPRSLGRL